MPETVEGARSPVELSVVIPVYNEEAVLPLLVDRLRPLADSWGVSYEVLCVDDGSSDATPVLLQRLRPSGSHLGRSGARSW